MHTHTSNKNNLNFHASNLRMFMFDVHFDVADVHVIMLMMQFASTLLHCLQCDHAESMSMMVSLLLRIAKKVDMAPNTMNGLLAARQQQAHACESTAHACTVRKRARMRVHALGAAKNSIRRRRVATRASQKRSYAPRVAAYSCSLRSHAGPHVSLLWSCWRHRGGRRCLCNRLRGFGRLWQRFGHVQRESRCRHLRGRDASACRHLRMHAHARELQAAGLQRVAGRRRWRRTALAREHRVVGCSCYARLR